MEGNNFANSIFNFNNGTSNQFHNTSNNIDFESIYPYGKFPIEKTKSYDPINHKIESLSHPKEEPDHTTPKNNNILGNIDLKTILPLITALKNKNKLTTYDLFNLFMPSLYKNNPNLKELLKFFKKQEEQPKSKLPKPQMQSIDSYVKA